MNAHWKAPECRLRCKFRASGLFTLLLLMTMQLACAERPSWKVQVLYWSDTIAGQLAMREGLRAQAQRYNQRAQLNGQPLLRLEESVAGDGPEGVELQVSQFYHAINANPDLIIVQPTDSAALAEPLQEANRNGIPVLAYDQFVEGGTLHGLVTSNNYQAGYLAGEVLADTFKPDHTIRLVLLEYPLVSSTVLRVDGFMDALEDLGQPYQLLKTYRAVDPNSGRRAAEQFLQDFPQATDVDAVFSVNDGGGAVFRERMQQAGRISLRLASVDGDPHQISDMKKNPMLVVDVAQLCGAIGEQTIIAATRLLQGQRERYLYQIPTFPVTRSTLSAYGGWNGGIPQAFNKPWRSRKPRWSNQIQIMSLSNHE